MSSYFNLELDTTAPQIKIDIPKRTPQNNVIEVTITSNENLSLYQEIFVIDSNGVKHDYTFSFLDSKTLYGYIDAKALNLGIALLYVTVNDEVLNSTSANVFFLVGEVDHEYDCILSFEEYNVQMDLEPYEVMMELEERSVIIEVV